MDGIEIFLEYYNNQRNHEALCNVTPIDESYDWRENNMARRKKVKQETLQTSYKHNHQWRESNKSKLIR